MSQNPEYHHSDMIHRTIISSSDIIIFVVLTGNRRLNDLMESKRGKKKSSSSNSSEAPLVYKIEDVRPAGGIEKFRSAAYSNV